MIRLNDLPLAKDALQTVGQEIKRIHKEKAVQFERAVVIAIKRAIADCKVEVDIKNLPTVIPHSVANIVCEKLSEKGYRVVWGGDIDRVTMFRVRWD